MPLDDYTAFTPWDAAWEEEELEDGAFDFNDLVDAIREANKKVLAEKRHALCRNLRYGKTRFQWVGGR